MSDTMLFGVLRMPYEMAMSTELSRFQFHDRAQQACDTIESLQAERDHHKAWVAHITAERDAAIQVERARIISLLDAIREHWVKANGADSMSVSALDAIAEVIADGTYVKDQTP